MRSYCGFSQIHDANVFVESCGGGGAAGVDADAEAVGVGASVEAEADGVVEVDGELDGELEVEAPSDDGFVTCEAAPHATSVASVTNNPTRERRERPMGPGPQR